MKASRCCICSAGEDNFGRHEGRGRKVAIYMLESFDMPMSDIPGARCIFPYTTGCCRRLEATCLKLYLTVKLKVERDQGEREREREKRSRYEVYSTRFALSLVDVRTEAGHKTEDASYCTCKRLIGSLPRVIDNGVKGAANQVQQPQTSIDRVRSQEVAKLWEVV